MTVEEFNTCVDFYSDGIYRFALKMLRSEDLAMDAVQDCFEKFWRHHQNVEFAKAKSYLFTSVYHEAIDTIRKEKRKHEYAEGVHETSTSIGYSDAHEVVNRAIEKLPDIQKAVLLLRDYEGYSYDEIAEITGLSGSQVKVYIYRARFFLKEQLVSIDNII